MTCIHCNRDLEPVLARLGALQCFDCRDMHHFNAPFNALLSRADVALSPAAELPLFAAGSPRASAPENREEK